MEIEYEDFNKLDIRVGLIKSCEKIPKSRNLYKLMVDCGENSLRQILTGISLYYSPKELVNEKIVVLTNLKPRKINTIINCNMCKFIYYSRNSFFCNWW